LSGASIVESVSYSIWAGSIIAHRKLAVKQAKIAKALQQNADKESGDLSDARASFFVGASMKIEV
jgi:hypothetical protein